VPRTIVEEDVVVVVLDQGDRVSEPARANHRFPDGSPDGVASGGRRKGKGPGSYGIERRTSAVAQRPTPAIQLATVLRHNVGSSS